MKKRVKLSITIRKDLLSALRREAEAENLSLSRLIENKLLKEV